METAHLAAYQALAITLGHVSAALVFIALFMVVFVVSVTLISQ